MSGWSEALDAQTALIGAYFSRAGREHLTALAPRESDLAGHMNEPRDSDATPRLLFANREADLQTAVAELRSAESVYVSAGVGRLLEVAAPSFEPEVVHRKDFFTPEGFAYFAVPLVCRSIDPKSNPISVGDYFAAQWRLYEDDYLVAFYALAERPYAGSSLVVDYVVRNLYGAKPANVDDPVRYLMAFLRFAQQRLTVVAKERAKRPARRRARAWNATAEDVTVVRLRATARRESEGSMSVDWTHRWLVRGHWRNQWYPSLDEHRQVWVVPHVKGPEDKPFVPTRRAFEVTR